MLSCAHTSIQTDPAREKVQERSPQVVDPFGDAASKGMLQVLDLVGYGGVLLNPSRRVTHLNERAKAFLGNAGTLCRGQLLASDRESNTALQELLMRILSSSPSDTRGHAPAVSLRRAEGRPLVLFAHRCPPGAVLIIFDPDDCREPAECLLRRMFGLTSAETRIAMGILRGLELREIAATHKVSEGTVRTQLKSVLSKTGTHRQVELVALLASLARTPRA
jgi:DNA-binding CsgD family transcriptional regulator